MKNKKIYPWIVVALLWGVALLNYMDRQMLSTMKDSMQIDIVELQSATNFGRLMAIFLWIYGLMSPVAGMIGDRFNRKWLIVGSLFVWSSVTYLMGIAQTFEQIYWLRALMGISEALYIPAGLSLIADYHSGRSRSLAVGLHMTGLYTGQAIGGFGATVAAAFSWQTTFHWFGVIGIVYALLLVLFLRDKKREVEIKIQPSVAQPKESLWQSLKKLPMSEAGPISTFTIALSSFVGVLFGGSLSDRWVQKNLKGRVYTSAIGLGLTIPSLLLLGMGHHIVSVVGAGLLFGIGFGMFDANNMPILCQFVSSRRRATAYGVMNMTGVFAGAAITDLLGQWTDGGNLGMGFAMLSIVIAVVVCCQLIFLRPKTDNAD